MKFLVKRFAVAAAADRPGAAGLRTGYPNRPITLIVPFSAGGPGDVIARLLGTSMSATLNNRS